MRHPMDILKNHKETGFEEEEVWDKKKLLFGVLFLLILLGIGYQTNKQFFNQIHLPSRISVKGSSTTKVVPINLQEKISEIKNEATNLNVADIASSSPQVQNVLNQIKNLGNLPKNEAKQVCEQICRNF